MKFAIIKAANGHTIDDAACACRADEDHATFITLFELEADDIDAACDAAFINGAWPADADIDCISDNITLIEFDSQSVVDALNRTLKLLDANGIDGAAVRASIDELSGVDIVQRAVVALD